MSEDHDERKKSLAEAAALSREPLPAEERLATAMERMATAMEKRIALERERNDMIDQLVQAISLVPQRIADMIERGIGEQVVR